MNRLERKRVNPFYVILVIFGVAFVITAFAYFLMALKDVHAGGMFPRTDSLDDQSTGSAVFVQLLDRYGVKLMIGELLVLGVATFAAIATDRYWSGPQE